MEHIAPVPTPLEVVPAVPESVEADWLVVPVFEGESGSAVFPGSTDAAREVDRAFESGEFRGKRFDVHALSGAVCAVRARRVVLLGGGPAAEFSSEVIRRLASACAIQARDRHIGRLALVARAPVLVPRDLALGLTEAASEGLTLGEFDPATYKTATSDEHAPAIPVLVVPGADQPAHQAVADRGRLVAHCANLARNMTNDPGNLLPPRVLAERAAEMAAGTSLRLEVLDRLAISNLGMGLLAGVGQGSHEEPRLITLVHEGIGAPAAPVLGLVGKAVTFDSGGLSIKSAEGMERMKDDMAGGAAVIAALRAISILGLPVRVIGVVPAVENMPGGGAIRPGDVLRGASGRTVEVVNTDAEGRLTLGDGLWYARRMGATHLVDIATLTGACTVALGRTTTGVFGRPDAWREHVRLAADACGERAWPLPLFEEHSDLLRSEIADTTNGGGRYGGACVAAAFIGEFAAGLPWAHLDIAGTAWNDEQKPWLAKGPTGAGVRTLFAVAAGVSGFPL